MDVAGETLRVYGFAGIPQGSEPVAMASPAGAHVLVWHNEGLAGEDVYPRGMLRLHLITPGYPSVQEEVHENCWEEILFLAGDLLMPRRGWGGPGTLLVNPAGYPHGPYVSQKGILLLVHSTSPMPAADTDFPAGPEICRHYLETTPLIEHACTDPWHIRPEQAVWEEMTTR